MKISLNSVMRIFRLVPTTVPFVVVLSYLSCILPVSALERNVVIKVEGERLLDGNVQCPSGILQVRNRGVDLDWNKVSSDADAARCLATVMAKLSPAQAAKWFEQRGFVVYVPTSVAKSNRSSIYVSWSLLEKPHPYGDNLEPRYYERMGVNSLVFQMRWVDNNLEILTLSYSRG